MKLEDIKNQKELIYFIENRRGMFIEHVPFYKEKNFNSILKIIIEKDIEINEETLIYFVKKFLNTDKTEEENIEIIRNAFCNTISIYLFTRMINNLDEQSKQLLGIKSSTNIYNIFCDKRIFKNIMMFLKETLISLAKDAKNNYVTLILIIISSIVFHTLTPTSTQVFIEEIVGFIILFLVLCIFIMLSSTAHNGSYFGSVSIAAIVVYGIYYFNGQNYPLIYMGEFIPILIYGLINWKSFKRNNML